MVEIIKSLEQTINSKTIPQEKAVQIQNQICPLLQAIFIKIGPMIDVPLATNIINLIIEMFKEAERVTENGLTAY